MEMLAASLPTARSPVLGGGEHHNERNPRTDQSQEDPVRILRLQLLPAGQRLQ